LCLKKSRTWVQRKVITDSCSCSCWPIITRCYINQLNSFESTSELEELAAAAPELTVPEAGARFDSEQAEKAAAEEDVVSSDLESMSGESPLSIAAARGHEEIVEYLVRKESKFEVQQLLEAPATACKYCRATDVPLKKCSLCYTIYYCSPECQDKDWREGGRISHKVICKIITDIREMYMERANKKEIEERLLELGILRDEEEEEEEEEQGPINETENTV
jgi:hypothetical protein